MPMRRCSTRSATDGSSSARASWRSASGPTTWSPTSSRAAREGIELDPGHGAEEKAQFDALTAGELDGEPIEEFDIDFVPVMAPIAGAEDEALARPIYDFLTTDAFEAAPMVLEPSRWVIRFAPHRELYARANDPLLLFRELAALGSIEVEATLRDVPPLADFEPFGAYCAWEITLTSSTASEADILEVFEFVDGNCDLSISAVPFATRRAAGRGARRRRSVVPPPPAEEIGRERRELRRAGGESEASPQARPVAAASRRCRR